MITILIRGNLTGVTPTTHDLGDYDALGEFHDLFMTEAWSRLGPVVGRAVAALGPTATVVDLGAGSGLGTLAVARSCEARIWALEPSTVMRSILLHRVADDADLTGRVSVLAGGVPDDLGLLPDRVDAALMTHVAGHLEPAALDACLQWLGAALEPDGTALVSCQEVSDDQRAEHAEVREERRVGDLTFRVHHLPDPGGYRSRYQVLHDERLLRSVEIAGSWRPIGVDELSRAAARHGLTCTRGAASLAALRRVAP